MRPLAWLTLLLLEMPALAASGSPAAPAIATPSCETHELALNAKEIRCSLPSITDKRSFRLFVNFSGGHDDTYAGMKAFLDDKPLACDAKSKTRLAGEDGDVSLTCMFTLSALPSKGSIVKFNVAWSHAEYSDYSFETN